MSDNVIEFTLKTDDKASKKIIALAKVIGKTARVIRNLSLVAVASAGAIVAFTKVIASAQDKAGKFAFKIGKSVEKLTEYQFAAKLSGIRTETFNMAVQRMERRLGEAALGTGEALSTLRDLGIEAKTFGDLPLDTQLETLADKFTQMKSGTQALKTAFKLFDSEGVVMLQLLKQGSPAMRAMAEEARKLGLVVSEQAAANSTRFNDSLTKLQGSIEGASRAIAELLMPLLTGLAERLTDVIANNRGKIADFFKQMITGFVFVFKLGQEVFRVLGKAIAKTFDGTVFENFVTGGTLALTFMGKMFLNGITAIGFIMLTSFNFIWDSFADLGENAWLSIKAFFTGQKIPPITDRLFAGLQANTEKAGKSLQNAFSGTKFKVDFSTTGGDTVLGIDVDKIKAQTQQAIEALSVFGEAKKNLNKTDEEETAGYLDKLTGLYSEYFAKQGSLVNQLATESQTLFLSMTQSIGDAVGQSIVQGENLMGNLLNVAKQVASGIIGTLIKIGIQRLTLAAIGSLTNKAETATKLGGQAAITSSLGFNASAALGLPGLLAAPGVAAGAVTTMLSGATGAGAAGKAVGAGISTIHGGLDFVPSEQTALLDRGERIVSPNQNRDLTDALKGNGVGSGTNITIQKISILENASNAEAFMNMPEGDMRKLVEEKILTALDDLDGIGIRQRRFG